MLSHSIFCICLAITMAASYQQDFLSPPLLSVPKVYHNAQRFPGAFENYFQPFAVPRNDENYGEANLEDSLSKNTQIVVIDGPGSKRIASAVVQLAKNLADRRTAVYLVDGDTDFKRLINEVSQESTTMASPEVKIGFYSNVSKESSSNSSNPEDDKVPFLRPSAISNATEASENLTEASTELNSTPSASYLPPKTTLTPPTPKENIAEPLFGFFLPAPESIPLGRKYLPAYNDVRTKRRQ